ncbi:MAG TPA: sulfite exporter TauE/SafE family protein [Candidatus Omnitrophota bacterium]|nr:sulfite exporter TauE/SafE family protein [Candidatus Omnitrophota bacterium]
MAVIIVSLFLTGVLFGAGPCLVSCGPVLISYICGTQKKARESLNAYTLFSLSRVAVYVFLSLCVFFIGRMGLENIVADYADYLFILAGFFLILLGVYFMLGKRMEIKPFNLIYRHIIRGDTKNIVLLGLAYGFLPCAPFLGVLTYIGLVSRNAAENIIYAVLFGAGTFVSPLLLVSLAAGAVPAVIKNNDGLIARIVRMLCGAIMVFMGSQLVRRAF